MMDSIGLTQPKLPVSTRKPKTSWTAKKTLTSVKAYLMRKLLILCQNGKTHN